MDLKTWWANQVPVGGNRAYVVYCNDQPFAGFDSEKDANAAREMYSKCMKVKNNEASANSKHNWVVRKS